MHSHTWASAACFSAYFAALAVVFLAAPGSDAASYTWQVPTGDWFVGASWGGTAPTLNDDATIDNNGTATIALGADAANNVYLGDAAGSGAVAMTAGSLEVTSSECVGFAGQGTFTQSAGNNDVPTQYVGWSGTGTFTQSGTANVVSTNLYLGYNSAGNGTYNLNAGALTAPSQYVGYSGTGVLNQSGTVNTPTTLYLGYNSTGNGTYGLSGGWLEGPNEYVGYAGAGTFTHSGGLNAPARTCTSVTTPPAAGSTASARERSAQRPSTSATPARAASPSPEEATRWRTSPTAASGSVTTRPAREPTA